MATSPVRIAVLDDYQGISHKQFATLPSDQFEITYFHDTLLPHSHPSTPKTSQDAIVARLEPFAIICTMRERTPFPRALLTRLPALKLLLTTGTRNAALDLAAAKDLGIRVAGAQKAATTSGGTGHRGPDSTTQHAVALVLAVARNVAQDDSSVKSGGWQTGLATGLPGKVFGTVGLGRLGVSVAQIMAQTFGMRVWAWSANLTQEAADDAARKAGLPTEDEDGEKTFRVVGKEELFRGADVLSVHYVLSERSRGIVGREDLERMKPSALLINTSRGPLIQEKPLLEFLKQGRIRGAAFDVFEVEPLPQDSEWRTTEWGKDGRTNVLLSPHMGYVEEEVMASWYEEQVKNILRWQKGEELLVPLA